MSTITPIGDVPLSFVKPTVGVCMAALNEGPDLEATLSLIAASKTRPDEIVIVDDCSREPIEPRLNSFSRYLNLRVIRNDRRVGSGRAKSMGLDACTSDVLVVMDAHMRPPWTWLEMVLDGFLKNPYSVLCPRSTGFEHPPAFNGRGCRFTPNGNGFWEAVWNDAPGSAGDAGAVIGCVLGGCYVFGRALMNHLGGFARHHIGWGYEEESFCLRAWIAGFDCRLLDFPMPHQYVRTNDRTDAAGSVPEVWEIWANRHIDTASIWHGDWYEKVYAPLMWAHYGPQGLREAVAASAPGIALMREHMNRIRVRSDQDVGFLLGIPHAEMQDQYRAFAARYGKV